MTKREFFEKELKMMPSEIGSAVPMTIDGEKEVTERWLMAFVKHLVEDLKEAKKWHTGIPTEDGWYLIAYKPYNRDGIGYEEQVLEYANGSWYEPNGTYIEPYIVAYQKIEPFEASTSHAGFCNTEGCSNSKTDMSKAQNHICPYYYQGVCSLDEDICCRQHLYEICDKFVEASEGRKK